MKKSRREKLIEQAESFAAGCSRSRLELRLVDEIHALEKELADERSSELPPSDTVYHAYLSKNYKEFKADSLWVETGSLNELLYRTQNVPVYVTITHKYEYWGQPQPFNLEEA